MEKKPTLAEHLMSRGVSPSRRHVYVSEEEYCATFLLWNLSHQLVGFQRYYPNGDKKSNAEMAKYYTYVSRTEKKKKMLAVWGLDTLSYSNTVFLVEGVFDAAKVHNAGFAALAMLTNHPKPFKEWLRLLNRPLVAFLDNDENQSSNKLKKYVDTYHYPPEPYKDLGDMTQEEVNDLFESMKYK